MASKPSTYNKVYLFYSKLDLGIIDSLNINLTLSEAKLLLTNQLSPEYKYICNKKLEPDLLNPHNELKLEHNVWRKLLLDRGWIVNINDTVYLVSEQPQNTFSLRLKPDYAIIYTPGWRLKLIKQGFVIVKELNSWYFHSCSRDGFSHLDNVHDLTMAKYMVDDYIQDMIYEALDQRSNHAAINHNWIINKLSLHNDIRIYWHNLLL